MKCSETYCKVLIGILLLLAAACTGENSYTPKFLTSDTLRLEVKNEEIIHFNPYTCQYAYNIDRGEFRMFRDNLEAEFRITLDEIPTAEGQVVNASSIEWLPVSGMPKSKKNIALEAVKLEGDVIWLWNSRESLKITVRFN